MKFKQQLDYLDVTEVSYLRDLLTMKHRRLISGTVPILEIPSLQDPRQELCYIHQRD